MIAPKLVYLAGHQSSAEIVGNLVFGLAFGQYVIAEFIRLVAPRYHERMLKLALRLARSK
jgi:hypothetical protein